MHFQRQSPFLRWKPTHDGASLPSMNINYLISVLCIILWIVALIDCIKGNNPNKIIWIVVIILIPFLGSILYFLMGRSKG